MPAAMWSEPAGAIRRHCATIDGMDCEVAREALSARLDGERAPVPSARVDEHLGECSACRAWFTQVASQAGDLRRLAESRPVVPPVGRLGIRRAPRRQHSPMTWRRWALLCVGIAQIALGTVQGFGLDVGLTHQHPTGAGTGAPYTVTIPEFGAAALREQRALVIPFDPVFPARRGTR